ncbi:MULTISPECIES: hypothetical protein [Rhizobium]|uniref:Uncharacterized protein YidB (DUF937 family) n=1 Tax=Rhizobium paranaense TaxID=1650438 RepID=A0A7W9D4W8_9HYPH|nr:uncharacterized protein YidB (DUF937 family) [Rhizobium paranaense]
MTALLAVLALAGYQNHDKIAEVLKGIGQRAQSGQTGAEGKLSGTGGIGDLLGNLARGGGLGDLFGSSAAGGILSGSEVFWSSSNATVRATKSNPGSAQATTSR